MYGMCGWIAHGRGDIAGATDAMSIELDGVGDLERLKFPGTEGASLIVRGLYPVDAHSVGSTTAVVLGDPEWRDSRLGSLAEGEGQAAAIIRAVQVHGRGVLERIHGPFALAVIEPDRALLAVDRVGIHTLSYGLKHGVFTFGSCARCVAANPVFGPHLDPQALYHFFYFSEVPSPGTVYRDVRKLLPAQYVEFSDGRLQTGFYWEMPYVDSGAPPVEETGARFRDLVQDSVRRNYRGSQTAAFLSGGTDSSTVTGMLARVAESPVHAYSMGFAVKGFDEMEYARIAARRYGAILHEYYVTPEDVAETLSLLAKTYDEPFGNESAISAYLLAKRARQDGYTVLLAGDGGDEIFGGNERYAKQMVFERYGTTVPAWLRRGILEPLVFGLPGGDKLWPLRKVKSYIEQAQISLPGRMETYNHLHRSPLESIFEMDFLSQIDHGQPLEMLTEVYFRTRSGHAINRMLHLDLKFTLADNDLRKVSRMCEAAGVEVRYPLLDETLVEFSGELPPDYKVRGDRLRWLFKEALRDFLPSEILGKSKHGLGLPFGEWALSHHLLRDEVESRIHAFSERGILRPDYLTEVRRRHAEEHAIYYGSMLWKVAILETWLQAHGH